MSQREQWRPVLDTEARVWKAKSYGQLLTELAEEQVYEVQSEGKTYQVEVNILESKYDSLHVVICVDDGSIPASFSALTESFICERPKGPANSESAAPDFLR